MSAVDVRENLTAQSHLDERMARTEWERDLVRFWNQGNVDFKNEDRENPGVYFPSSAEAESVAVLSGLVPSSVFLFSGEEISVGCMFVCKAGTILTSQMIRNGTSKCFVVAALDQELAQKNLHRLIKPFRLPFFEDDIEGFVFPPDDDLRITIIVPPDVEVKTLAARARDQALLLSKKLGGGGIWMHKCDFVIMTQFFADPNWASTSVNEWLEHNVVYKTFGHKELC